ncbi:hypothetical protein HanIR_Chr15g0763551 [Helianthus annuus]|nr:hypothetical protein HanIR_Chr15g0763551 [Helianthus annuus]
MDRTKWQYRSISFFVSSPGKLLNRSNSFLSSAFLLFIIFSLPSNLTRRGSQIDFEVLSCCRSMKMSSLMAC